MTRLQALPLAALLAVGAACASGGDPRRSFADDAVEPLGSVDTPQGPVELGRRKVSIEGRIADCVGPIGRGAGFWHERVVAVPGYGLVYLEQEQEDRKRTGSHSGLRAVRIIPPEPTDWKEREQIIIKSPANSWSDYYARDGTFLEHAVGADPLRPDRVLLSTSHNSMLNPSTVFQLLACRRGAAPEAFPHTGYINHASYDGVALRAEAIGNLVVVATVQPGRTWKYELLDSDYRVVGALPPETQRLPIHVHGNTISIFGLGGAYVLPSKENPKFLGILGPDGKFGAPDYSMGVVPVFQAYIYFGRHNNARNRAVVGWLVPQATKDGLRWGLAKADRSAWSGPLWKDVRLDNGNELEKVTTYDQWLFAQELDSTWRAIIPGPPISDNLRSLFPDFKGYPDAESAYRAAEGFMGNIAAAQAKAAKEDAVKRQKEWQQRQEAREASERWDRENSFFGTRNLIYGQPREAGLGQFVEDRRRQAIEDMKRQDVYDKNGRPYDWLNKK